MFVYVHIYLAVSGFQKTCGDLIHYSNEYEQKKKKIYFTEKKPQDIHCSFHCEN